MAKIAIKNENITSFGEIYHIMDRVTSELGVVIERFRADCGSFSKEIIQTVEQRCNTFYIRAANCDSRCEDFRQLKEWKGVEVGYEKCDVTSISIDNLIEGKSYRLVVQRSPLKDKHGREQTDIFGAIYTYRCILTNNRTSTEKDIITFYNERVRCQTKVHNCKCSYLL